MKSLFATLFTSFFCTHTLIHGYSLDVGASYDYFRNLPDGSWNGNSGAVISANGSVFLSDCFGVQLGGSYGGYNWNGRGNVVFENPNKIQQIGFFTAGAYSTWGNLNAGAVYDRLFTGNFSIFNQSPSIDQARFQVGYLFCNNEIGVWGTHYLSTKHETALGLPVSFRAINQVSAFWSYYFQNNAKTTVWLGAPYENSLRFPGSSAGYFICGFALRAPLCRGLFLDGYGSYMSAKHDGKHQHNQNRNYGASVSVGITYSFNAGCGESPYMPIANHSNFFVDINRNQ